MIFIKVGFIRIVKIVWIIEFIYLIIFIFIIGVSSFKKWVVDCIEICNKKKYKIYYDMKGKLK